MLKRLYQLPALVYALLALCLAMARIMPAIYVVPQHPDEARHAWRGHYYVGLLVDGDFRLRGTDEWNDPAWNPLSYWLLQTSMGTNAIYGVAIHGFDLVVPTEPYSFADQRYQGPDNLLSADALIALRWIGAGLGCVGLALIALRMGLPGLLAVLLFLLVPHVPRDLAHANSDGPLLLGFGLCVLACGRKWFPVAAAVAPALKLTGLVAWPLVFRQGLGRGRWRHLAAVAVTSLMWTLTTPYSWVVAFADSRLWFLSGPLYAVTMAVIRFQSLYDQSFVSRVGFPNERRLGLFLPTRYLWPVELAVLLGVAFCVTRYVSRRALPES